MRKRRRASFAHPSHAFLRRKKSASAVTEAEDLSEVHADRTGFRSYLAGAGRIEHDTVREFAEAAGVFGVPSFIVDGELFWGREHLADIREKLAPFAQNDPVRVTPSS